MLAFAALCKAALELSGDAFGIEQEMKYYFHVQSSPREPRRLFEMPRFVLHADGMWAVRERRARELGDPKLL